MDLLPNELLLQIAEQLLLLDLNKFVRTGKKVYQTCKYLFVDRIIRKLRNKRIVFVLRTNDSCTIDLMKYEESVKITQWDFSEKDTDWIFKDFLTVEQKGVYPAKFPLHSIYTCSTSDLKLCNLCRILKILTERNYILYTKI